MSDNYAVIIEGLESLDDLENLPDRIKAKASQAVNSTARTAQRLAAAEMMRQVNFPAGYLKGDKSRLNVVAFATPEHLEATIRGRARPTSLARFAKAGSRVGGRGGVPLSIKPGSSTMMKSAFLMKLRAGASSDDKFNIGLAYRTKDGKRPPGAYKPVPLGKNLWLLYGPSVDQVFKTVRKDISGDALAHFEREFDRLMSF